MQRIAVTGLLIICIALALGLGLTGVYSYRAASRSARDVLAGRASHVSSTFVATARLTRALSNEEQLQQLAEELSSDDIGLSVLDLDGRVLAAAGGAEDLEAGQVLQTSMELVRDLRLQGQAFRFVDGAHLEYIRPLRGPRHGRGRGPGGGFWRRWKAWREQGEAAPPLVAPPDPADQEDRSPPAGPAPKGPGFRPAPSGPAPQGPGFRPRGARHARLLRVTVAASSAEALTQPARLVLTLSGIVSVVLLVLGIVMHRAARRALAAEKELRRQESLAALGEMAAVLAHEIRTPLGRIKGNAQLIGEQLAGDDRVEAMVSEAGRLERLVNGLLDYARPPAPRAEPCDPDAVVARAAGIVAPRAAEAGVNLVTDPAECGTCLRADADQLLQVLVNLLQNAIEAAAQSARPEGAVIINARQGGGKVTFTVLDPGPGLGEADPQKIFRPFYTTKKQGTGLGLSVARQIIEQHGGTLTLSPRKEGGTAAKVTLPQGGRA